MDWQRLGHAELSSGASTIDTGTFEASTYLQVIIHTVGGASCKQTVQFNGDSSGSAGSSGKYFYRASYNGGSYSDSVKQIRMMVQGNSTSNDAFGKININNISGREKVCFSQACEVASGASNAPERSIIFSKWIETTGQITSIQVKSDTGNNFGTGSYITVFGATGDTVTDEKQTLADATVTTSPTPTLSDDFSGTDDWTDSDSSNTGVNTTTDLIDFTIDSSADTTTYDLTTVSNTAWVLRFKVKWLTKNTNTYATFGISDNTSAPNVSQDIISMQWRHDGSNKWYGSHDSDGSAPNGLHKDNLVSFDPTTSTDYYFEIVRQTATTYIVRRYSDSTYGTVSDSASGTCASTTQTLRYIKFAGWTDCNATSTAEIDDVKFYNGITAVTSTTTSLAPPVNTRYEEVDTRKIYRATSVGFPDGSSGSGSDWTEVAFDSTTAVNNATATGNVVSRSSGSDWTSYIRSSVHYLDPSEGGGEVYFTTSASNNISMGLEKTPFNSAPSAVYTSRDYSFHTTSSTNNIYESGSDYQGTAWSSNNDEFRITMDSDGLVKYYWRTDSSASWTLERTSNVTASGKYYVSVSPQNASITATCYIKSDSATAWKERGSA